MKVLVIGQIVPESPIIDIPSDFRSAKNLMRVKNFTHVETEDNRLVNHLTFIKESLYGKEGEAYSLWQMYLCSTLLLGSHLARNGYKVKVINYIDSENEADQYSIAQNFNPEVVVLSTTFILSNADLRNVGRRLRNTLPNAYILAGGHHIYTALMYMDDEKRKDFLGKSDFDAFVNDAQGEKALLDFLNGYPDNLSHVNNLIWKRHKKSDISIIVSNEPDIIENRRQIEENDINSTLIDLDLVDVPPGSVIHIRTARSCSFKCAFCSYPSIAGDLAIMDLENVISTLLQCKEKGIAAVIFSDDTFNVPKERFELLLDMMIVADIGITWYSFLRCQFVTPDIIRKMKLSGCDGVFIGVESASDSILKNMNKGAKSKIYFDSIKLLEEAGIFTVGSFVVGFPGETEETIEETRQFILNSGMSYYYIQPFYYVHHTPINKKAEQYGLKGSGLFWSHDTMNSGQAIDYMNKIFIDTYNANASRWVCPDGTMWEIAYLRSLGFDFDKINGLLDEINRRTVSQMSKYQLI